MINQKLNQIILSNDVWDIRHVIARYIKTNMLKVSRMTLTNIADECNVSKGMISKFIKELGYNDFSEFLNECKDYLHYCESNIPENTNRIQENLSDTLDSFFNIAYRNNELFRQDALKDFLIDLESIHYVYVYGKDEKEVLAQSFQLKLDNMNSAEKLGFTVILVTGLMKERVIDDNSIFLSFTKDIEKEIEVLFSECIFWNVRDFFEESAYLTDLYLYYWIDEIFKQIYVHKL